VSRSDSGYPQVTLMHQAPDEQIRQTKGYVHLLRERPLRHAFA
jgi:hypothetical protein